MNWGYKILIVIICFVCGMLFMVTVAMKQTNEMFDEEYYVKELTYQELIDAEENLNRLSDTIQISQSATALDIILPAFRDNRNVEGEITFLRPSDQSRDFIQSISDESLSGISIPKSSFVNGEYKVRFKWKSEGVNFYKEKTLFIQ